MPEQIVLPGFATMFTDGVTTGLTVIATWFEVAVVGFAQTSDDVSTQVTISPLASEAF